MITEPEKAERVIADGQADAVFLARACFATRCGPACRRAAGRHAGAPAAGMREHSPDDAAIAQTGLPVTRVEGRDR